MFYLIVTGEIERKVGSRWLSRRLKIAQDNFGA
jgi:hypothetical protein